VWLNQMNYLQTCDKTAITFKVMTLWQTGEVYTMHIITTTVTTTTTINIIIITIIIINFIVIILPQNPRTLTPLWKPHYDNLGDLSQTLTLYSSMSLN